jgi:hypothetical protein
MTFVFNNFTDRNGASTSANDSLLPNQTGRLLMQVLKYYSNCNLFQFYNVFRMIVIVFVIMIMYYIQYT